MGCMMIDTNEIGVGKKYSSVAEAIHAKKGMYKDEAAALPIEDRLPMNQMPKGRDPMPFSLGGKASGERK
jgi:hypothetical protein